METRLIKTKTFHQKILCTRRIQLLQTCRLSFQISIFFGRGTKTNLKITIFLRNSCINLRSSSRQVECKFYNHAENPFKFLLFGQNTRTNKPNNFKKYVFFSENSSGHEQKIFTNILTFYESPIFDPNPKTMKRRRKRNFLRNCLWTFKIYF